MWNALKFTAFFGKCNKEHVTILHSPAHHQAFPDKITSFSKIGAARLLIDVATVLTPNAVSLTCVLVSTMIGNIRSCNSFGAMHPNYLKSERCNLHATW
jgi:hypothetical protein